ncbi:MAG: ubiquinol-cytochrome c reductase iron-sulfur subunit [Planctomycetes bacterium]|uniref:ubiquinol-cytochrome c reductase iron-sulfur subunit n=1 Tax=Candidatus Wunengus sp. YC65 TaxID=3367701 RepID=UPI001D1D959C|nr:ubiquinol-cytochrome c reductase iron-sulfur subunit [Planctomycetota bacterium]
MESGDKKLTVDIIDKPARRGLLLIIGWVGFLFFSLVAGLLTTVDFFKPKVIFGPSSRFKAGFPDEYLVGKVSTRWMKEKGVWIIRTERGIYAFLAICRHLGCIPDWVEEEHLFKCPCHGSNYNLEGDVVGGPAPSPLFRVVVSYAPDGQLVIDKSIKEDRVGVREKGQFFLPV